MCHSLDVKPYAQAIFLNYDLWATSLWIWFFYSRRTTTLSVILICQALYLCVDVWNPMRPDVETLYLTPLVAIRNFVEGSSVVQFCICGIRPCQLQTIGVAQVPLKDWILLVVYGPPPIKGDCIFVVDLARGCDGCPHRSHIFSG